MKIQKMIHNKLWTVWVVWYESAGYTSVVDLRAAHLHYQFSFSCISVWHCDLLGIDNYQGMCHNSLLVKYLGSVHQSPFRWLQFWDLMLKWRFNRMVEFLSVWVPGGNTVFSFVLFCLKCYLGPVFRPWQETSQFSLNSQLITTPPTTSYLTFTLQAQLFQGQRGPDNQTQQNKYAIMIFHRT